MSVTTRNPCDSDEVDEEKAELREIVDRYDNLMENCWRERMQPGDERELNLLHEFLTSKEDEAWGETSPRIVADITDQMEIPFPLLRHLIDMLPE